MIGRVLLHHACPAADMSAVASSVKVCIPHHNLSSCNHTILPSHYSGESEVCVFITAGPIMKLCARGEGDSEGHVL
jgi:hypothetical protein